MRGDRRPAVCGGREADSLCAGTARWPAAAGGRKALTSTAARGRRGAARTASPDESLLVLRGAPPLRSQAPRAPRYGAIQAGGAPRRHTLLRRCCRGPGRIPRVTPPGRGGSTPAAPWPPPPAEVPATKRAPRTPRRTTPAVPRANSYSSGHPPTTVEQCSSHPRATLGRSPLSRPGEAARSTATATATPRGQRPRCRSRGRRQHKRAAQAPLATGRGAFLNARCSYACSHRPHRIEPAQRAATSAARPGRMRR